jgi:hypothetical protein
MAQLQSMKKKMNLNFSAGGEIGHGGQRGRQAPRYLDHRRHLRQHHQGGRKTPEPRAVRDRYLFLSSKTLSYESNQPYKKNPWPAWRIARINALHLLLPPIHHMYRYKKNTNNAKQPKVIHLLLLLKVIPSISTTAIIP